MPSTDLPITISVRRPDGSTEQVRVGTASPRGEGFALSFFEMAIGDAPTHASAPFSAPISGFSTPPAAGVVFPPYGRSKGAPVVGATLQDLEFYANGCRRSLGDPSKARWHDKERVLLATIEAEIARQRGEDAFPPGPPPGDDDIPF